MSWRQLCRAGAWRPGAWRAGAWRAGLGHPVRGLVGVENLRVGPGSEAGAGGFTLSGNAMSLIELPGGRQMATVQEPAAIDTDKLMSFVFAL